MTMKHQWCFDLWLGVFEDEAVREVENHMVTAAVMDRVEQQRSALVVEG